MNIYRIITVLLTLLVFSTALRAEQNLLEVNCGNPYDSAEAGGVGPYDLHDPSIPPEKIDIVVRLHFTPYMEEMAINGSTTRRAVITEESGGDERLLSNLDYTLRAIPNHARALYAMGMWQLRTRESSMEEFMNLKALWGFKSAECYFKRAIMFTPDDAQVHLAFGIFRHRQGSKDQALKQYLEAIRLMPGSAEAHYNVGLLYVEKKDFASAREHAWKAYELGYPLPGLRNALEKRGEWRENPGSAEDSAS